MHIEHREKWICMGTMKLGPHETNHLWLLRSTTKIQHFLILSLLYTIWMWIVPEIRSMFGNFCFLQIVFLVLKNEERSDVGQNYIFWNISCRTLWIKTFLQPPGRMVGWGFNALYHATDEIDLIASKYFEKHFIGGLDKSQEPGNHSFCIIHTNI